MRHPISSMFVLAAILAPTAGAVAQETTRAPVQARRAAPAEANDRRARTPPADQSPRDRAPLPPGPTATLPDVLPPAPPPPLSPPTLPSPAGQLALPPLPLKTPTMGLPVPSPWSPTPPVHAPQPMMPPGPGPQQPGRYTLVDREISVLDAAGPPTSLGTLTLLFDSATGEVSYLTREGGALAWRVVPRPPMPPHHPPAGHPVGPWTQPHLAPPGSAPYLPDGRPPSPLPPSLPAAPLPPLPMPTSATPGPFTEDPGAGPPAPIANPLVDTAGFRDSVAEADRLRAERRVGEAAFLALATPESVILDCRSRESFARLHVRGAVNLPFPDITAGELARLIPSPDTRVLIYCNNNFAAAPTAFPEKVARAALNHHSFATLVAYGYRNVFELAPLVDVASTEIPLEGDDAP